MNFYNICFTTFLTGVLTNELKVARSGLTPPSICKVGLEFYVELNNTSGDDQQVELIPDECCLAGDQEDCNSVQIVGECSEVIPSETTKSLTLVAPLLDSYERVGFCTIHIDSRPVDRKRDISRETLTINFDTRVKGTDKTDTDDLAQVRDVFDEAITHCEHEDEDPLNDCMPVNCETYYNGKRSYSDRITKRCIKIPPCVSNNKQVYNPIKNICVSEIPIADHDIEFIKALAQNNRHQKDILIIRSGDHTQKYNTVTEKLTTAAHNSSNATKARVMAISQSFCRVAAQYVAKNKYTIVLLGIVIVVQCCLIISMIYCMSSCASCSNKKKVFCKFFNYRQDASVTTPLIGTSNDCTETTEFDFISESSTVDKKIKCYKACQKENNAKISMSDDILSKCLNRRDWRPMSVPQTMENEMKGFKVERSEPIYEEKKTYKVLHSEQNSQQLSQEHNDKKAKIKSDASIKDVESLRNKEKHIYHSDSAISETEIHCFNYNFQHSNEFKPDITSARKTASISTEKGAQADFSNDSIDDFLSERGIMFFGENASKLSFSSTSTSKGKSSLSNLTSKTSKNNIVRQVLSYLTKSRYGPSSDPGVRKSRSKDLELIHISRMSAFSSSCDLDKNVKVAKESRSSF